jgi:hypothetical protein
MWCCGGCARAISSRLSLYAISTPTMGSNSQHPPPPKKTHSLSLSLSFFLLCTEQCPQPPLVDHSMIAPVRSFYNKGTRIFYTCAEGYLSTVSERTCESGGVWSGPEPVCQCKSQKERSSKTRTMWVLASPQFALINITLFTNNE